jgi:pimeloyl-ACP methyl ester carboxylesterase
MAGNIHFREMDIHLPHLRFAARCWGPETGVPVLALHGWLDNAATYDHLAPLLPELRIVALDLHGHGFSDHLPPGMTYHFSDMVDWMFRVAEELGWEKFNLMGHSLGAAITSFMAGTQPDRIQNLIAIEGLGPYARPPETGPQALRKSMSGMRALEHKTMPLYPNLESAVQARFRSSKMKLSSVRTLVQRGVKMVENGVTWASDPRLRTGSRTYFTEGQVQAFLRQIRCPTLLIHGDYLFEDSPEWQERMRERCQFVSDIQDVLLPGKHHLHLDEPEGVAQAIRAFLQNRI